MTFKLLKKNSEDKNRLNKLVSALEQKEKPQYESNSDEYWKLSKDKQGNGSAIIRFLSTSKGDENLVVPFIEKWNHGFQGKTGQWYIENSLTTIGQDDPVSEYNTKLWETGDEQLREFVRSTTKRRLTYTANILVVTDPEHPENNGKVFKYEFGSKIYEKISAAIKGNKALKKAGIEPYDYWKGADFVLSVKKKDGYFNYDDSGFEKSSVIHFEDGEPLSDDEIEKKIYDAQYSLSAIVAPDQFKSYDVLKARLNKVLGLGTETVATQKSVSKQKASKVEEQEDDIPDFDTSESNDDSDDSGVDVDAIFKDLDL